MKTLCTVWKLFFIAVGLLAPVILLGTLANAFPLWALIGGCFRALLACAFIFGVFRAVGFISEHRALFIRAYRALIKIV